MIKGARCFAAVSGEEKCIDFCVGWMALCFRIVAINVIILTMCGECNDESLNSSSGDSK